MKYRVLNKCNQSNPPFRKAMLNLLSLKANNLLLGYGYMSDIIVTDNEFIKAIKEGFKDVENPSITIIGKYGFNEKCTIEVLESNADKIRDYLKADGIDVDIRILVSRNEDYHKKIAIKKNNYSIPEAVIIGSSNFSAKTIAISNNTNQEVDILFWRSNDQCNKRFLLTKEELEQENNLLKKEINESIEYIYDSAVSSGFIKGFTNISIFKKRQAIENMSHDDKTNVLIEQYRNIQRLGDYLEENKLRLNNFNLDIQFSVNINILTFVQEVSNEIYDPKKRFDKIYPVKDSSVKIDELTKYYDDFRSRYIKVNDKNAKMLDLNRQLFQIAIRSCSKDELIKIFNGEDYHWKFKSMGKYSIETENLFRNLRDICKCSS